MLAVIVVAFIAATFFTWFFKFKSKEDERRILIEKGVDPSELPDRTSFNFSFPWLKIGIIITFIALGGFLGGLTEFYFVEIERNTEGFIFIFSMVLLGGIGMIIAHYIDQPNDKN